MSPPNIFAAELEARPEIAGFSGVRRARLGPAAGAEHLGASLWETPPGQAAYPYHYHLREEELIVVLAGRPTLRTPEGRRVLEAGEVVAFPVGERGAHQLLNDTDAPMRFLSFSLLREPEVCFYPDSGKVRVYEDRLGERNTVHRLADAVDYWEGERPG